MKYLICDNCQNKNPITSDRLIFCKQCQKKLANNYLDWKKEKFNSTFEEYLHFAGIEESSIKPVTEEKNSERKNIFLKSASVLKSISDEKSKIFIYSLSLQIILFSYFFYKQGAPSFYSDNSNTTSYLNHVKWKNVSITSDLSLTLPFELIEANSMLPPYLKNHINSSAKKSESSQSFSVTIEELTFENDFNYSYLDELLKTKDEYMSDPNTHFISRSNSATFNTNSYKTYSQQGAYKLNEKNYLFDDYTLIKNNKVFKITVSYLKNDKLLRKYADVVSESLLNNNNIS